MASVSGSPPRENLVEEVDSAETDHEQVQDEQGYRAQSTNSIMDAVNKYMVSTTDKLEKRFERLIEKSSDDTIKKTTKKIKLETPALTRPGCEDQHKHNYSVLEHIGTAEKLIKQGKTTEALDELAAGKKLVLKRQKLVRLADREENGWSFVKEYVADDLASGSDDEKKISKARTASSRKRKTRSQPLEPRAATSSTSLRYASKFSQNYPNTHRNESTRVQEFRSRDFRKNQYDRQCYGCGRRGHLLYSCPSGRKSYY